MPKSTTIISYGHWTVLLIISWLILLSYVILVWHPYLSNRNQNYPFNNTNHLHTYNEFLIKDKKKTTGKTADF